MREMATILVQCSPWQSGCTLLLGVSSIPCGQADGLLPPNAVFPWEEASVEGEGKKKQRKPSGKCTKELCCCKPLLTWKCFPYRQAAQYTSYMIFTPMKTWAALQL